MKLLPTAPAPGTPVSSSLIRELIDAIRARTLLRGHGYTIEEKPNGTILKIQVTPARKQSHLPGLFEVKLEPGEQGSGSKKVKFEYPYFMVGTRLYRCEDKDVELPATKGIYCLIVDLSAAEPKGVIDIYADFEEVQEAASSQTDSIKPLYEFDDKGVPIRDFRNMPTVSSQEFNV